MALLMRGLRGDLVKRLQEKLGLAADGIFGSGTEKTVKEFQEAKGLSADGIAGPDTFAAMGLFELILLKRGTRGVTVKKMQEALGIDADGKFGPGTEKAVKAFQAENGLTADGVVGSRTLEKLNLPGVGTPETAAVAAQWEQLEESTPGTFAKIGKILAS